MHSNREETWNIAAGWYAIGQKNFKYAIKLILKGLVLHPNSALLYKRALKLHLSEAQFTLKRLTAPDDIKKHENMYREKINLFIEQIFENVKDFQFYLKILALIENYEFLGDVKTRILQNILENHSEEPLVWHELAQKSNKGSN